MDNLTHLSKSIEKLKSDGLYRSPKIQTHSVSFGSNDYFGMSGRFETPTFKGGSGSSKYLDGYLGSHAKFEKQLCEFEGSQDCVLFGSGYLASMGVLSCLPSKGDTVIGDKSLHACLIDGVKLSRAKLTRYQHNDLNHLEDLCKNTIGRVFIATESVFSMEGDMTDLNAVLEIAKKYDAFMIVDNAHGLGICDTAKLFEYPLYVQIGTMSKALGSYGGFVCTNQTICEYIRNFARTQIFTTSLPEFCTSYASLALDYISRNLPQLQKSLAERYVSSSQQSPIFYLKTGTIEAAQEIITALSQEGIYAPLIRPPTVQTKNVGIRFSSTLNHSKSAISNVQSIISGLI